MEEIAKHAEVTFALSQLATHNVNTPLDMQQWRYWFSSLSSQALSQEQAKALLGSLTALVAQPINTHVALFALFESLARIPEVGEHVKAWALPNQPEVIALNEALQMREYLGSANLNAELVGVNCLTEDYAGGEGSLPPRLLVLFQLKATSPAYSTYESLIDMGLTHENQELLHTFVLRREKILAMVNQTGIITGALSNLEKNALTQHDYLKVFEQAKRRDFGSLGKSLQALRERQTIFFTQQFEELQERVKKSAGDKKAQAQFEHQKQTLQDLALLRNYYFDCLNFFIKKELHEGFKLFSGVMPIHQQMLQICDNSVALIFVGTIKTGKSTIVESIIGENVAPSRIPPMTAFPVRYVHDPNATEPVMLVPFALQLNKVVRSIKLAIQERTKEVLMNQLSSSYLRDLADKIDRGLVFRNTYSGAKDVLESSVDIHDLFRLAVQGCFDPSLAFELPLAWNQGLDSFLTVSVKFPDSFGISSSVKLSVIDTPGVNEDGVKRLNLMQVIYNAVEVSHYIAFTADLRTYSGTDFVPLKRLILRITSDSKTPTMVLATNRDNFADSAQAVADHTQNIALSLRKGDMEYPLKSVFLVSGKRKQIADKMMYFINKHNRKPEFNDEDPVGRTLAFDFAFFAAGGFTEEEKREDYEGLSMAQVKSKCASLIRAAFMKEPLDLMANTAAENSSILSCNKAIEKSLQASSDVLAYLKRLQAANEADENRAKEITIICEEVYNNISSAVHEVRASLFSKISTFRSSLKRDCEATLNDFKAKIDTVIAEEGNLEFANKQDADAKAQELKQKATGEFEVLLDQVLDGKRAELDQLAGEVEKEVDEKIFKQLARVVAEIEPEEQFRPEINKPSFKLDTASFGYQRQIVNANQKQASLKSTLSSLIHGRGMPEKKNSYNLIIPEVRLEAILVLEEFNETLINGAGVQVKNYMSKILNDMFLLALHKVLQTSEALREREKVREGIDEVRSLLLNMQQVRINLQNSLRDLPE